MAGHQVAVLGLGLIGASLGLALKQHDGTTVVGFDPSREAAALSAIRRAADRIAASATEAIRGADTVVLAAPVRSIMELLTEIAPHLAEGTVVTDTGSTKAAIVDHAAKVLPQTVAFVGGHPLAGRLRSRVTEADADLFVGATYCLCPTPSTPEWGIARATQLVEAVGAIPHYLDPNEHDALLAAVSHLPYFASTALVTALGDQEGWPEMGALAAGGFRTATSLVDGSPQMWTDIALTNAGPLDRQLGALIEALSQLRSAIAASDPNLIASSLDRAFATHRDWAQSQDGGSSSTAGGSPPTPPKRRFPFWR